MRLTAAVKRRPPAIVSQGVPLPAPVGGWDAISPLANMPVDRAVKLDNWVCRPGWIEPRPGFIQQCTGLGAPVQTIMAYNGPLGTFKLFGVAGTTIWDCTIGPTAAATSVTTLSTPRLQYIQFSNPNTEYLIAVNGMDVPKQFDGTTWADMSGITGTSVVPSSFINVTAHQGRLWFVQDKSTNAVYMDTIGGITGGAHVFPLGQFFTKGGYLQAIGTWTVDTRQNVNEYIAFISSRGQVIVYTGNDPSTASTFFEVGLYNIGRPIGARCFSRIAGDLLIITVDGVVGMSEMLSTDRAAANRVSLTSIIMNAVNQSAQAYRNNFGWQIIEHPLETLAILNIPVKEANTQIQYVMNTITGAWSSFSGLNGNCWEITASDQIYFGGNDGDLYEWNVGSLDENIRPINCFVQTAYNSFGNAPQRKRYTAIQPLFTTTGNPVPSIGIDVDFQNNFTLSTPQPYVTSGQARWNEVKWNQFKWKVASQISASWQSVCGTGHYVSVITQVTTAAIPGNPVNQVNLQLQGWNVTAESGAFV